MTKLLRCLLIGLFLVAATSCVRSYSSRVEVSAIVFGEVSYPSHPVDHPVVVYEAESDITQGWEKIGRITAQGVVTTYGATFPQAITLETALVDIMARAREIGADAVVLQEGFTGTSEVSTTTDTGQQINSRARSYSSGMTAFPKASHTVIAIKYLENSE